MLNKIIFEIVLARNRNLSSVIQINTMRIFLFSLPVFCCCYSHCFHLLREQKIHNNIKNYYCVSCKICYYNFTTYFRRLVFFSFFKSSSERGCFSFYSFIVSCSFAAFSIAFKSVSVSTPPWSSSSDKVSMIPD